MNTRVVAISVDDRKHARQVWEKTLSRQFTVLSDPGARVIRTYGILHPGAGDMGQDIALDTTLLMDVDGRERWRRVSQTITDHLTAEDVLERLRRSAPKDQR